LAGLPPQFRPRDETEAYTAQRAAHGLLSSSGYGTRAGWKIGCTTAVMQAYLGVENPCAGGMFLAHVWRGSHTFAIGEPPRRGAECEIAVRIAHDLPGGRRAYELADVADAVAACMPAIEVVENRYVDYASIGTPTLIADDFFHHSAVLGREDERCDPRRLRDATATMEVNGHLVGTGRGTDVMGEPLEALRWLANRAVEFGVPVRAGEVVLLGSLVETQWARPGDVFKGHNDMLGAVSAAFEE